MIKMPCDIARLQKDAQWDDLRGKLDDKASDANLYNRAVKSVLESFKALGAVSVITEREYIDQDFSSDFSAFYSKVFKRYKKVCSRLHFFRKDASAALSQATAKLIAEGLEKLNNDGDYLGFIVVRPLAHAPLGKVVMGGVLSPNATHSMVLVRADYEVHLLGARLRVTGTPFTQQDSRVGACAQAAIWVVGRHVHTKHRGPNFSMADITEAASKPADLTLASSLPAGSRFLSLDNMVRALHAMGRKPLTFHAHQDPANPNSLVWPSNLVPQRIIGQYVDSGIPVIIGLYYPGQQIGHAVVAVGQTTKTLPAGATLGPRPTRSDYVEHFLVNDDQLGTYLRMPVKANGAFAETPYSVEGNVAYIIVPLPEKVYISAEVAEQIAWPLVEKFAADWPARAVKNKHKASFPTALCEEFTRAINDGKVVARTYLTYGWKYQKRIVDSNASDGLKAAVMAQSFPRFVWVTEFGTIDSFNRLKIKDCEIYAHAVIDATSSDYWEGRSIFHAPSITRRWYHNPDDNSKEYVMAEGIVLNDRTYSPKAGGGV